MVFIDFLSELSLVRLFLVNGPAKRVSIRVNNNKGGMGEGKLFVWICSYDLGLIITHIHLFNVSKFLSFA